MQILRDLEPIGLIDIPQNFNDLMFSYKDFQSPNNYKAMRRSKSKGYISSKQPIHSKSIATIQQDSLLKNTSLITPNILSKIISLNRNDPNNIEINSLPNFIIEDIYKRGLIQNVVNDPVIFKAIENVWYPRWKDG